MCVVRQVVLGPWYSVRVLIQHSVITFHATSMADTDIDAINNKKHVQFLSCDRSTRSCIYLSVIFCRQGHIHDPVLLTQDRNFIINSIDIGIGHTRSTEHYNAMLY